jgi:hypothetical protein
MYPYLSVSGFHHDTFFGGVHPGIHVHQTEEVKAHGRREAARHHAGEYQTVFIGLMVRSQVVQVQEPNLENGGVRAVEHVPDYYC